jgi:hypothetical protein
MNSLLTTVDGMDEFVVTPEPNVYLVALRITPEQAEAFDGNERISIALRIEPEGTAGVMYVRGVDEDNQPNGYVSPSDPTDEDDEFTDAQCEVLGATEQRVHAAVVAFHGAVKDDLDEYYIYVAGVHGRSALDDFMGQLEAFSTSDE